ncbi:MAG: hypothetical protein PHE15_05875 [Dehalococcoidales bacterium]|nr:hypothetical protein [Dehalococcoidales bacterium]
MESDNFKYDIAFSFLAEDENIAERIGDELRDRMNVFIYSERQKDLVGKDGVEKFSKVFKEDARICVVLYRPNWGKTKWTRIEETAIKDRIFEKGWEFLVVISIDSSQIPHWLPKSKLWLGFDKFGIQGAASVIDARFQETGGKITDETPSEKADRLRKKAESELKKQHFLDSEDGVRTARQELTKLFELLSVEVSKIAEKLNDPNISLIKKSATDCFVKIQKGHFTVAWSEQYTNSLQYSSLFIREFDKGLYSSDDTIETRIHFTLDKEGNPSWVEESFPDRFLSSKDLAKRYLDRSLERAFKTEDTHPRGW